MGGRHPSRSRRRPATARPRSRRPSSALAGAGVWGTPLLERHVAPHLWLPLPIVVTTHAHLLNGSYAHRSRTLTLARHRKSVFQHLLGQDCGRQSRRSKRASQCSISCVSQRRPAKASRCCPCEFEDVLRPGRGTVKAVDGVSLEMNPRRRWGSSARVGVGRASRPPIDPENRRSSRPDRRRRDLVSAPGRQRQRGEPRRRPRESSRPTAREMPVDSRRRDRVDLPGADVLVQPGSQRGQSDHRGDPAPSGARPPGGTRQGDRDAAAGRRLLARSADRPARKSAERRPAPARDDRDGALVQSYAVDRGRAHHRARRDHADTDPRADAPAPARKTGWRSCSSRTTWA